MVVALIAAALAAAYVPATPPARIAPDADPAIWVVNDRDTVIFLFGTFHALDLAVHAAAEPHGEGWWQPLDRIGEAGLPTLYAKAVAAALATRRALAD